MNQIVRSSNVRFIILLLLFLIPFVIKSQQRQLKPDLLYERAVAYMEAKDPHTGAVLPAADYAEAARLLQQAAVQDFAVAQRRLGDLYRTGRGVPEDKQEAVKWFLRAADNGDALAQMHLGVMYDSGEGVGQDEEEAFKWFHRAAGGGEVKAQLALATMYGGGHGTRRNTSEAMKWYRKAAGQGSTLAQYALGVAYEEGFDGVRSRKEAVSWYTKAAQQGMLEAKLALLRFSNPVTLTSQEASANLIGAIVPKQPAQAREEVSGRVTLRIFIDRKGYVTDTMVLAGHELLNESAVLTAAELRYKPFFREGEPVEGIADLTITY